MMYRTTQNDNNTQSNQNNIQETPDKNYILCGRGKVNVKHQGNKVFAKIIQSSINDYSKADTKIGKVIVVASVVDFIHEKGMKFVTYDTSTKSYVELSSDRIHTKVSHAIRDQMKQQNKKPSSSGSAVRVGKQQRRSVSPVADSSSCSTKKKKNSNKRKDDGFNAWWSQHKNECCEKIMNQCTPSSSSSSLAQSRTIFDLGANVEESTFGMNISIPEAATRTVSGEMESSNLCTTLPLFPLSYSMDDEEQGTPLPVDCVPEFKDEDVERIVFSLILDDNDNDNEQDNEAIEPLSLLDNNDYLFPDECFSSQIISY